MVKKSFVDSKPKHSSATINFIQLDTVMPKLDVVSYPMRS